MTFKKFVGSLNENGAEGELVKGLLYSIISSFALLALLYFVRLQYIENFIPKYGLYLILVALSYAIIIVAMKHTRAYRKFPCMSGMMIGMTIGMIAGFLPGFFIGATNGMFYGSVFGMLIGIIFGIINGNSCGIMGVMEGIMAGFMGGLMGAMTAVMMINDNLHLAAIIVFIISSVIMTGLSYMIYKETRDIEKDKLNEDKSNGWIVLLSIVLMAITVWLMVFGPRSALFV
jgi:hypothetical protein